MPFCFTSCLLACKRDLNGGEDLTKILDMQVGVSFFFHLFFNVYGFLRETESKQGRGRERGRRRIPSRLRALSCQHGARRGARTHGP